MREVMLRSRVESRSCGRRKEGSALTGIFKISTGNGCHIYNKSTGFNLIIF